jgi:hypothetical protein
MRLAVVAAAASLAAIAPGDRAAAKYHAGDVALTFHYEMTCGRPGPGPVVVHLPAALHVTALHATVNGAAAPASRSGGAVAVALPRPSGVTCMSITEGTLRVTIASVHGPAGTYQLQEQIRSRSFTTPLRIS